MRPRLNHLVFVGGMVFVWIGALLLSASPVNAFSQTTSPCALITKAKIAKTLGLSHVSETTVIGASYPREADGRVASNCKIVAWSGSKPKTSTQVHRKLANGTYALAYIRTWFTDQGPDTYKWVGKGFDETLKGAEGGCYGVMKALHGDVFPPPPFGAQSSIGYQSAKGGVANVCGIWNRTDTYGIIVILLDQSKHKPVVRHLETIAKTATPAFF